MPTTLQIPPTYVPTIKSIHWLFNYFNSNYITTQQLTLWKQAFQLVFKTLFLTRDKGGLGLPNLKYYFWAAQLTTIVGCIRKDRLDLDRAENN